MLIKKIQKDALDHYTRMMNLSRQFHGDSHPSFMKSFTHEGWEGADCIYCHLYRPDNICPLYIEKNILDCCAIDCCDGLWEKMAKTQTISKWYLRAYILRMYIAAHGHKVSGGVSDETERKVMKFKQMQKRKYHLYLMEKNWAKDWRWPNNAIVWEKLF